MKRRVLIFGSRRGYPYAPVVGFVNSLPEDVEIVVGGDDMEDPELRGVDAIAADQARARGLEVTVFRADWKKHGKAAGPIRNGQMAIYATEGHGFRVAGESRGTDDMERKLRQRGKPVVVVRLGVDQ